MKQDIINALREQAKQVRKQAESYPPIVKLGMIDMASRYDIIAENIESGVVQLRQVGQLRTIK